MKRLIKQSSHSFPFLLFILLVLLSSLTFFSACDIGRRYDNGSVVDGVYLMRNKLYKKSLAARCLWDGDTGNMVFTVPDEYCGFKVKCLGAKGNPGFTGNPGSFEVRLPKTIDGFDSIVQYHYEPDEATSENTTNLNFIVNLGKYVNEIEEISKGALVGYGFKNNEGEYIVEAYYNVQIYYNIDSDNSTFYSKDGDIYYKSNDQMVTYRY